MSLEKLFQLFMFASQKFQMLLCKLQGVPCGQIVELTLILAVPLLPASAWNDEELAELALQVGKMVEHHRSKSSRSNYPTRWTIL